jgi:hypothetical protein
MNKTSARFFDMLLPDITRSIIDFETPEASDSSKDVACFSIILFRKSGIVHVFSGLIHINYTPGINSSSST